MNRPATQVARVVLCGVLAVVSAVPAARVFAPAGGAVPGAAVRPVLVAVAAAVAYGVLAALWRRGPELLTVVVGVVAVAAAVAAMTRPGGAVLSGPYRLLTTALPADPAGPELATVAALAGYTALASAYLVLRGGPTPLPPTPLPLLPALVNLGAGLAVSASTGPPPPWCAPAFLAAAALVVLAGQPLTVPRAAVTAVAIAAVAGLAVPWLAAATPTGGRTPADIRSLVAASVQPRQRVDPMAQFRALRQGSLRVDISGHASGAVPRLRMVTLTDFDGSAWTVRADYRRAGSHLPAGPAGAAKRRTVTADLTIGTPATVGWLPTVGRATEVSVRGLGVEESTGDLVVPEGAATPASYRVTGGEPAYTRDELVADHPVRAAGLAGPVPADLTTFVRRVTAGGADDFERFGALRARFAGEASPFRVDSSPNPPGGNGYYQLSNLLRSHRGTSEQYASAFAVFCRYLGWDARVVLGFRTTQHGDRISATNRDVAAWVEIHFARLGWLPFDPSPTRDDTGAPTAASSDPIPPAPDDDQQDRTPPPPASKPGTPAARGPAPQQAGHGALIAVVAGGIGALAVLLPLAIPLGHHRRRHRRRTAPDPRAQVIGAWQEAVEALYAHRVPVPRRGTTGQALAAAGTAAAPHLGELATRVDHAGYAPGNVTAAEAADAWQHSDAVRHAASATATRYIRTRALFTRR